MTRAPESVLHDFWAAHDAPDLLAADITRFFTALAKSE